MNSRLDEVQAAVLRARLPWLPAWTDRRRQIGDSYRRAIVDSPLAIPPEVDPGHVYHLFPVMTADRGGFQAHLASRGIGSLIHYPVPLHRQPAFSQSPRADCPVADRVTAELCSLPLHPFMADGDVDVVVEAARTWRPAGDISRQ